MSGIVNSYRMELYVVDGQDKATFLKCFLNYWRVYFYHNQYAPFREKDVTHSVNLSVDLYDKLMIRWER